MTEQKAVDKQRAIYRLRMRQAQLLGDLNRVTNQINMLSEGLTDYLLSQRRSDQF